MCSGAPHLLTAAPADGGLFRLQQALMGLLHQLGHSGLDLRSGGVIQLPQAPRVALFRGDLGIPAEPADADESPGPGRRGGRCG